jgi:hypothetical protein
MQTCNFLLLEWNQTPGILAPHPLFVSVSVMCRMLLQPDTVPVGVIEKLRFQFLAMRTLS